MQEWDQDAFEKKNHLAFLLSPSKMYCSGGAPISCQFGISVVFYKEEDKFIEYITQREVPFMKYKCIKTYLEAFMNERATHGS